MIKLARIIALIMAWLATLGKPAFGGEAPVQRAAKTLVWVRDDRPAVNPTSRPTCIVRRGRERAGQQENEFQVLQTAQRRPTSFDYREVNTNTAPSMVQRIAHEYRLTWSPPAKVLRADEPAAVTIRLAGASASDGRDDGVPWQLISAVELSIARSSTSRLRYTAENFAQPQTLKLVPPPPRDADARATICFRVGGGDAIAGTTVEWTYHAVDAGAAELASLVDAVDE